MAAANAKLPQYDRDDLTYKLMHLESFFLKWLAEAPPSKINYKLLSRIYNIDGLKYTPKHWTNSEIIEFLPSPIIQLIAPMVEALIRWAIDGSTTDGIELLEYVRQTTQTYLEEQLIGIQEFCGIEYLANRLAALFKCYNNGDGTIQDKINVYLNEFSTLDRGSRLVILIAKWWTFRLFDELNDQALEILDLIIQQDETNWLWYYYRAITHREIRLAKLDSAISGNTESQSFFEVPSDQEISSILKASKLAIRTDDKNKIVKCMTFFCRSLAEILETRIVISPERPLELSSGFSNTSIPRVDYKFHSYNQLVQYISRRAKELPDSKDMYAQHLIYARIFSSTLLPQYRNYIAGYEILLRYSEKHVPNQVQDKTLVKLIGKIREQMKDEAQKLANQLKQLDRETTTARRSYGPKNGKENQPPCKRQRQYRGYGNGQEYKIMYGSKLQFNDDKKFQ